MHHRVTKALASGVATVSKEVLSGRTADYQAWVEAYARNHRLPIEWAEKGVRKEDHVLPWQRRIAKQETYGVYFIFKSMEQGATFRVSVPKYATKDPNYRILAPQRSRFTHYYFYIRDAVLGPMVMRVASFFPFQTSYYLNGHSFIEQELRQAQIGFRKIDNAFLAVDDVAVLQAAADKLSADIICRPVGVPVSMPRSRIFSATPFRSNAPTISTRWATDRANRSNLVTTKVSPSRTYSSAALSRARSATEETCSLNTLSQPSASSWRNFASSPAS
jgi:hypothetical protein